ncbi:hypothetical protein COX85_02420 [Candidatus Micrarchaeota archaeon CG_4_10_14_0_2_um_filter_55_9]|nr:MAG: hypothetical protein AUJ15_00770 [Candidatus Micrarchaeota archaeon CG1_02_55_41]PIO03537.1 MAG: hypothetical protein COT57_00600 [Candidatus Micrarchaeota archaeon CG09_land_8_20_14_0_10_55_25]PIZ91706.1 MAG: hypothetical protein COX85_02420 [Candidatus Micrarchaeota archaeon CG_4_10_14_0_2_um_filter_55_9]PJD00925.1 MAG: hypothetical protein COU38_03740 [Candidatus Micrarchaeota archaeon CG10_big_fil_rev_8_21_14_0_10_54_18]
MRKLIKEVKNKRSVAYATVSPRGRGIVHLKKEVSEAGFRKACAQLGLTPSFEGSKRNLTALDSRGQMVATLVDNNLLILSNEGGVKRAAMELAALMI